MIQYILSTFKDDVTCDIMCVEHISFSYTTQFVRDRIFMWHIQCSLCHSLFRKEFLMKNVGKYYRHWTMNAKRRRPQFKNFSKFFSDLNWSWVEGRREYDVNIFFRLQWVRPFWFFTGRKSEKHIYIYKWENIFALRPYQKSVQVIISKKAKPWMSFDSLEFILCKLLQRIYLKS